MLRVKNSIFQMLISQLTSLFGKFEQHIRDPRQILYQMSLLSSENSTPTVKHSLVSSIAVAQRRLERAMLGITILDRRTNEWVRLRTQLKDLVLQCDLRKWCWVKRISGLSDFRWAKKVIVWNPREDWKRGVGRPRIRWTDDFKKTVGTEFLQLARAATLSDWKEHIMELRV